MAFTRPRASQINFDTTNITDTLIRINSSESGDNANDLGIIFERGNHTNAAIVWDESADAFRFISTTHDASTTTSDINISAHHNLHVGTLAASSLVLDGTTITATPANFNVLDGLTVTTTELNYVDGVTSNIQTQIDNISSSFTLAADSGTPDTFTTGQTFTIAGGTGIDTTVSDNNISIAIDSTVATLTGSQTLTNKTLTSPTINAFSGTGNGSITGTLSIVTTTTDDSLLITTTEDSSSAAPVITLKRNSSSVADADYLGQIKFKGENDADQEVIYAKITGKILDASVGTEDGIIEIAHKKAGSNVITARFRSDSYQLLNGTQLTVDGTSTFNGVTVNSSQTINMGANAITSVADPSNAQDAATKAYVDSQTSSAITATSTDTLTNKTLTSPSVNTEAKMLAQAELEFYDSDSSNYVSFRGPATVGSNITWTLPNTDGTDGQMLSTNGAGTLSWADGGGGGGSGSSYPNSTFSTVPGTDGNFDMSYNVAQTSQETPFEDGGTDAFGVNLGSVFSCMDPIGTTESIDYADGEAYVGA